MPIAQSRISTVSITEPRIHALVESILRQQNTAVLGTCFMEIPRCSQHIVGMTYPTKYGRFWSPASQAGKEHEA